MALGVVVQVRREKVRCIQQVQVLCSSPASFLRGFLAFWVERNSAGSDDKQQNEVARDVADSSRSVSGPAASSSDTDHGHRRLH